MMDNDEMAVSYQNKYPLLSDVSISLYFKRGRKERFTVKRDKMDFNSSREEKHWDNGRVNEYQMWT
jgi:hypothetical protein